MDAEQTRPVGIRVLIVPRRTSGARSSAVGPLSTCSIAATATAAVWSTSRLTGTSPRSTRKYAFKAILSPAGRAVGVTEAVAAEAVGTADGVGAAVSLADGVVTGEELLPAPPHAAMEAIIATSVAETSQDFRVEWFILQRLHPIVICT